MPRAPLPRGVYRRGDSLWIRYGVPKAIAAEHGCARMQRESTEQGDVREASRQLAQRRREIRDLTWRPKALQDGGTVQAYVKRWTADRKAKGLKAAARDMEFLAPLLVRLGPMRLDEVKRAAVQLAMNDLIATKSKTGEKRAPWTIYKAYSTLRAMYNDALRAELVLTNPCTLRTDGKELPKRKDANPRWRLGAIFTRAELEQLISDERLPSRRRLIYAILGLSGVRLGEMAARTWADYDASAEPLGRLIVPTQHDEDELKTENPREVPVHPVLASILARWKLDGYPLTHGRRPKPDDLIIPSIRGKLLQPAHVWQRLQEDLETLGMRRRRVHDFRRTFISLARADGARGELLRWVTHGPSTTVLDGYTTPTWADLCSQVSCLSVSMRIGAKVVEMKRKAVQS